jgi:hypothetical protein
MIARQSATQPGTPRLKLLTESRQTGLKARRGNFAAAKRQCLVSFQRRVRCPVTEE